MKESPTAQPITPSTWFWVVLSTIVAVLGLAAVWAGVSAHFRSPSSWMLVVVAVDAALMLRLAGLPGGRLRLALAAVVTSLTVLAAALLVSATQIGMSMGMPVQHALPALSPGLVWMYLGAQLTWLDALWLLPAAALGRALAR